MTHFPLISQLEEKAIFSIFRQRVNHICVWISSFVYLLFGLTLERAWRRDYRNPLCHLHLSFKLTVNSANSALLITTTASFPWKHHFDTASALSPDCVLAVIKFPFSSLYVLQKSAEPRDNKKCQTKSCEGEIFTRQTQRLFVYCVRRLVLKGKVTLGGSTWLRLEGWLMEGPRIVVRG